MSSINYVQERGFPDERKKLDGFRLFDTGNPQDTQNSETNSTFSVRKSLAWDSAFFTSPGVLDSEELSIVNKGSKKCETQKLPGVEEVLRGRCLQNVHSSKKTDASPRKSMKAMSTSQRQSLYVHQQERILKEVLMPSQRQHLLNRRKIFSCVNLSSTAATKRSMGGNYVQMGTAKAAPVTGQCSTLSKKPCLGSSSSVTHSCPPSPKSSSSESSSSSMNQKFISNASQASDMVHCVGHENQETSLPDENIKSSGLRVPSPKIGFFEEEIALVRASGSMHFHSGAPSLVLSRNGTPNRYGKLKHPKKFRWENECAEGAPESEHGSYQRECRAQPST
ncbi:hypothetical protein M0R45_037123 [Rubus argutus]|uniref:Uncharacterized protein n=1 Tax=Rubus argutus TaxID=59490 RepID=A0AAW1W1G2_RUBAR